MLVLQFIEDLPDRGMERFMRENLAGKWFCAFALSERPPDHSFFGDFRQRPGTKRLMDLFNRLRDGLKEAGLIREVFTFVDAGKSVSKLSTRDDRDKAIARGLEKFNNETADQVAADPQARFGAKGRDKFRYGYKEHTGVDMQSGLINRVAATPANVTDARGVRHVCPETGTKFKQDGTGKTGSPDRRRDLPDLIRRTGPGFQGTGTSGGSRPIPGLRAGPEHVPSREGFFAAGHAGIPDIFFHRRYRANSGATPPAVSPRVSGGHFVSGGGGISFQMIRR